MNERVALKILTFAVLFYFTKTQRYNQTTQTINYLFSEERYDKRLRPGLHEKVVIVTVGMTIISFGQVREKEMDYSIDIFFYQKWYDERLNHSLQYPINLTGPSKNLVWIPDTFFLNIKTVKTHDVPLENAKVTISNDGLVRYSTRLTLTAGCEMKLLDYPLDTQACNLTMLSYSYQFEELDFEWAGSTKETVEIMNDAMNEFYLKDITLHRDVYKYTIGDWTHLNMIFTFKRRVGYSLLQVYAPILLIVTLSWLSFWISKDAAPARIALGITTVLTIVTLMGSLRTEFPKVSYVKAIDLFFIVSFLFVFGAVMEYILVLLKCAMDEKAEQQKERRQIHFAQQVKDEYMKGSASNEHQENGEENSNEEEVKSSIENGMDLSSCKDQQLKQRKGTQIRKFRKTKRVVRFLFVENNGHIVDRVSRVVFPLLYLLFNVIYWLFYSLYTFH